MLNAERFKEEINKHNNEFGLADNIKMMNILKIWK